MQADGDFLSSMGIKSTNSAGWLVSASQQLFREDINKPALIFLERFKNVENGGFFTHRLDLSDYITDVLLITKIFLHQYISSIKLLLILNL